VQRLSVTSAAVELGGYPHYMLKEIFEQPESLQNTMRGRLSALHIAVVTSGPRIGDVEAGTVAALTSVRFSVVSGGLACIAGVALMHAVSPVLARYRRD